MFISDTGYRTLEQATENMIISKIKASLDTQLRASPVPALGVIPDGVVSAQTDPLGNGPVLLHLLGQNPLLLGSSVRHDEDVHWLYIC